MIEHLIHSHIEFQVLLVGLGLVIVILAFYGWVSWRDGQHRPAPKFAANLRRRVQPAKRTLKQRHSGKENSS